ncbi:MAG: radical SAM protein [Deltaproteobacteria bacterium]|nr:radical SAM protein [Deltaproteobacteria bacterium]
MREDRCQTPIAKLKTISLRPPIDLMYAAGSYRAAGADTRLRDYAAEELTWDDFERDVLEFQPEELLLSITTLSLEADVSAAERARAAVPNIRIGAIGAHFNTLDRDSLVRYHALDFVIRNEYESACFELGEGKPLDEILGLTWREPSGEIVRNAPRPFEDDLDRFAFPARDLIRNDLYTRPDTGMPQTTIVTNRGCPFHCIYCLANQVAGTKNRYRSVAQVIDEIQQCILQFGIRDFLFRSELFTQNKRWVTELCEAIIARRLDIRWACNSRVDTLSPALLRTMRRAGCWIVAFGVESGDQATLDRVQKRAKVEDAFAAVRMTRDAGIKTSAYLLVGLPWDTHETLVQQITFAKALDPDFLEIFYPYPFPGTPLHTLAITEGLIADGEIPQHAYSEPAMRTRHLSIDQLRNFRVHALRRFYLRPRVIARTLAQTRSPREMWNYVRAGVHQLTASQAES